MFLYIQGAGGQLNPNPIVATRVSGNGWTPYGT
jgi:hypothetical protein